MNLEGQLFYIAQDDRLNWLQVFLVQGLQNRKYKHGGFTHAWDRLTEDISTTDQVGNALLLHIRGVFKTTLRYGKQKLGFEAKVLEGGRLHTSVSSDPI